MKKLIVLLIGLMILVVLPISSAAWPSASWAKKQVINVTENTGVTQYNYTVLVDLPVENASINDDFSDIRFYDGLTELGYWIDTDISRHIGTTPSGVHYDNIGTWGPIYYDNISDDSATFYFTFEETSEPWANSADTSITATSSGAPVDQWTLGASLPAGVLSGRANPSETPVVRMNIDGNEPTAYVDFGTGAFNPYEENFEIGFWMKLNHYAIPTSGAYHYIWSLSDAEFDVKTEMYYDGDNDEFVFIADDGGRVNSVARQEIRTGAALPDSGWHHYYFTAAASTTDYGAPVGTNFYIDGVLQYTNTSADYAQEHQDIAQATGNPEGTLRLGYPTFGNATFPSFPAAYAEFFSGGNPKGAFTLRNQYMNYTGRQAWVMIPELPASAITKIDMYYDNAGASAATNGTKAFLFFDDASTNKSSQYNESFSSASIDWVASTGGGDTGPAYKFTSAGIQFIPGIKNDNIRVTFTSATDGSAGPALSHNGTSGVSTTYGALRKLIGGSFTNVATGSPPVTPFWNTQYAESSLTRDGTNFTHWFWGDFLSSATVTETFLGNGIGFYASNTNTYVKNFRAQNYVTDEPTVSIGASVLTKGSDVIPTLTTTSVETAYNHSDWDIYLEADDNHQTYLTSYVQFWKNDATVGAVQTYNLTTALNTLAATLLVGNFTLDDNLTAQVWIGDGVIGNTTKTNFTKTVIFNDTTSPAITINSPTATTYNVASILFNITSTDNVGINSTWFNIGGANITLTQDGATDFYNYTNSSIPNGVYTASFFANDSAGNINNTETVSFTVAIPTLIANVTSPSTVYSNTNYLINLTVTGAQSYLNSWIQFFKNGVELLAPQYFNLTNGTNQQVANLTSGNFTGGDILIANVIIGDSTVNNSAVNLSSSTVQNSIPTIGAPTINDTTPQTDDIISCTNGSYSDADGDSATWYYRWYDSGVLISGQTSNTLDLSISGLDKADTIICSTIASDGTANATAWTNSTAATIQNIASTLTANSTTSPLYQNTSYNITLTATDPDDSYLNVWIQFYVNDTLNGASQYFNLTNATSQQAAALGSGNFSRYDNLTANIIIGDGTINNSAYNLTDMVTNAPPEVYYVNNGSEDIFAPGDWNVLSKIRDLESSGSLQVWYTFYINDVKKGVENTRSGCADSGNCWLNLPSLIWETYQYIKGDNLTIEIHGGDGVSNTTKANYTTTVVNSNPEEPSQLEELNYGNYPHPALYVGDEIVLNCSGSIDYDGDPFRYLYSIETESIPPGNSTFPVTMGYNNSADDTYSFTITTAQAHHSMNYWCAVSWDDGANNNTFQRVAGPYQEINDSLPTQPSGSSVTAGLVYLGDTLTGTGAGSTDADADTIVYNYEFYNTNDTTTLQAYSSDATYVLQSTDVFDRIRVRVKATVTGYGNSTSFEELTKDVSNYAPTIPYVNTGTIVLNGGTTKDVVVTFNASDLDGYANLNHSTAVVNIYKSGETTRTSSACNAVENSTSVSVFNCTVTMQFYDGAGTWNINASVSDDAAIKVENKTFTATVSALDFTSQDVSNVSWGTISAGTNDNEASGTITMTNDGNQDYGTSEFKGYNSTGTTYSQVIPAASFSVSNVTLQTSGQVYMVDSTYVAVSQLNLNSHGPSVTEEAFFYIDLPNGFVADTYTSDTAWSMKWSA